MSIFAVTFSAVAVPHARPPVRRFPRSHELQRQWRTPRARMAAATHHGIKWSRIACATAWVRVRTPSLPWAFLR
jgi:hypothetical protein